MEARPLGVGIIGAGNIIKRHATAYRALRDQARLVAVADIALNRAEKAKELYGFEQAYDDYRPLLARDDIEVVSVCTPANFHAPVVIDCLRAGKHVLCEKPMATTLAEADAIVAAADQHAKSKVSFVFQLRSDPSHRRVRRMIEAGHVGRILMAKVCVWLRKEKAYYTNVPGRGSWKNDGGGVLVNQAIHQTDALISFLGEPVEVSAVMDTFVQPIEAEDSITGWARFASGAIATIDCTVCAHRKQFTIDVLGENAAMRVGGDPDGKAFEFRIDARGSAARKALHALAYKEVPAPPRDPNKLLMSLQKLVSKSKRKAWAPPAHWGHAPYVREFLEAVRNGTEAPVPPREARRSLELVAALYESALTKEIVALPLDETSRLYHGVRNIKEQSAPKHAEPALV
ncbi:MAG TPA: Gfo/Idh/MocA family oxidoreductase [Phycisphaerae bacterium]